VMGGGSELGQVRGRKEVCSFLSTHVLVDDFFSPKSYQYTVVVNLYTSQCRTTIKCSITAPKSSDPTHIISWPQCEAHFFVTFLLTFWSHDWHLTYEHKCITTTQ
jgi:hypothetical protein